MGKKKERRMSKSAAVYIPVGVLLITLLTIMGTSGFLRVTEIIISGATIYSEEDIIALSGISMGDNLLFIDAGGAERRIQGAMPFINSAKVSRMAPDKVRIEVAESTAIASIEFQGDYVLIDSTGRVLQRSDKAPDGLIEILGIEPSEAVEGIRLRIGQGGEMQLQYMLDVLVAIEREGIQDGVSYLDVSYLAQITFGYLDRFRVVLGGPNNLRQKLSSLPGAIAAAEERAPHGATGTLRSELTGEWAWTADY